MTGTPKQMTHPIIAETSKKIKSLVDFFTVAVTTNLKAGQTEKHAIKNAKKKTNFAEVLKMRILDGVVKTYKRRFNKKSLEDPLAVRNWWLNETFYKESLTLSARINDLSRFKEIESTIRKGFKEAKSWTSIATKLQQKNLQVGDVAKTITELERAGRRLMRGDTTAYNEYRRELRGAEKRVKSLIASGAPNQRLIKAYQSVIDATKTTSEKALTKALDRAIRAKIQSNAERISRTEISKAYIQGTYEQAMSDSDVIGIRYSPSASHNIFDICDFHTGTNMFNLGAGGYPLNNQPPYPFHPHCTCVSSFIYVGEAEPKKMDAKKGASWIKKQSADDKQSLLGKAGKREFNKKDKTWQSNLNNYQGHKSINVLQKQAKGV